MKANNFIWYYGPKIKTKTKSFTFIQSKNQQTEKFDKASD